MQRVPIVLLAAALATLAGEPVLAQEESEPQRCIQLSRINNTEVVDEKTIAFYLRGGRIYLNQLRRECRGLSDSKPFSYRTSTGRLCSVDSITVLENYGFGLTPGASCGLGMFVPIDEDSLAILLGDEKEAEITVTDIDVAAEEETDSKPEE